MPPTALELRVDTSADNTRLDVPYASALTAGVMSPTRIDHDLTAGVIGGLQRGTARGDAGELGEVLGRRQCSIDEIRAR